MGIYTRPNSPFYWANLERQGQRPLRVSLKVLIAGATPEQTKENATLAEAAYYALMGDLARRKYKLPSATVVTFNDRAAWYEEHHTVHHDGAMQEIPRLARLREEFGALALEDVTPDRWQQYVTRRTKIDGVSPSTVGRELAVLKAVLNTAVGSTLLVSPLAQVKRKNTRLKAKRTITAEEEPVFLKALKQLDREIHDLYVVGVGTLLRQENLLTLHRGAHRGEKLVLDTKTGPHQVPLTGPTLLQRRAASVLKRRMPAKTTDPFFPRWKARFAAYEDPGHPRVQFLRVVKQAAAAAEIPWGLHQDGIVWHTATRASGATRLLRDYKVDIRTVQLLGNWSSLDQMADYLGIDLTVFRG